MNGSPQTSTALALAALLLLPSAVSGQIAVDSVGVQVQAAQAALGRLESPPTVWIDPRPELREDSLAVAVLRAFEEAGFRYYESPGVPSPGVLLIAPGRIVSRAEGPTVSAVFHVFGPRTDHMNRFIVHTFFRLKCDGGDCVLGEWIESSHGDGSVSEDCWEDYFARSEPERRVCWYRHRFTQ